MRKYLWPILFIVFLWFIIVVKNTIPNTWLSGWDNLHPEFNLFLNIKRSFFAVWQEYQGLGLLGGMGHAADLPRQLILLVLSAFVPIHALRYIWTFSMLLVGAVGTYLLLLRIVLPKVFSGSSNAYHHLPICALTGSLFYLLNFATLQMFSVPFEPFVTHFGLLPWLLLTCYQFVEKPTRNHTAWLVLINILAIPQGYVPTIFIVYLFTLLSLSLGLLFRGAWKTRVKHVVIAWFIILSVNAFWLLPFSYFTSTKTEVTINAKINQMATGEMYAQNKAYGSLLDTIQLKGYWFDTFDFDPQKNLQTHVINKWKDLANTPFVMSLHILMFGIMLTGGFFLLTKRKTGLWGILILFASGVTLLSTDTLPFSLVNTALRERIPLFAQVFRFPFTKIGTLTSLSYALLLGVGTAWFFEFSKRHKFLEISKLILVIPPILFGMYLYPLIRGELFYSPMKTSFPKEYFELYTYLKTQPLGHIANLPQNTYWGWTYARWGYTGSGFLWYGVEQPILDRAFDVWSAESENYYWELSRALYAKNPTDIQAVLNKYDVRYILLDENLVSPSSNRAMFTDETKDLLAQMPGITIKERFGKLTLYELCRNFDSSAGNSFNVIQDKQGLPGRCENTQSFIRITDELPVVGPAYQWTDNDVAYRELGDYVSSSQSVINNQQSAINFYPFRSLFTKRSIDEREFSIHENEKTITMTSPDESTSSAIIKKDNFAFEATPADVLKPEAVNTCGLLKTGTASAGLASDTGNEAIKPNQNYLRFQSLNQRNCLSFGIPNLSHKKGYIVTVESRHATGRPLTFALINETAKHVELETELQASRGQEVKSSNNWQTDYFILPPLAPDGLGYSVYIANDSIGRYPTVNGIRSIRFYTFPYQELVSMHSVLSTTGNSQPTTNFSVSHPNPAYYDVELTDNQQPTIHNIQPTTLILNQAFDPGWKAYIISNSCQLSVVSCQFLQPITHNLQLLFPFLFGTPINDHVMVNNWANGWDISQLTTNNPQPTTIVLFFLPQLLEWAGFLLLPIPFLLLVRMRKIS